MGDKTFEAFYKEKVSTTKVFTIANIISLGRLCLLPFILLFITKETLYYERLSFFLLLIAVMTDPLDGYIARRFNQVSVLGNLIDPIIDKGYTASIAVYLILFRDFPLFIASIILLRDLLIMIFGYAILRKRFELPKSDFIGKLTGCAYGACALSYTVRWYPYNEWFAWLALIFTFISGINYLIKFLYTWLSR